MVVGFTAEAVAFGYTLDGGQTGAEAAGDVAVGLAVEFLKLGDDVLFEFGFLVAAAGEVYAFFAVVSENEVEVTVGHGEDELLDVLVVEFDGFGAVLELDDVAAILAELGAVETHDVVGEVAKDFAAGEVVESEGVGGFALWDVSEDEHGPVVGHAEADESEHDVAGFAAFLGVDAEVGEVVNDDDRGLVCEGGALDFGKDEGLVGDFVHEGVVDIGDEEVVGEWEGGVFGGELFLAEFEVDVEDSVTLLCKVDADLEGEGGLAEAGVAEEDGGFVLDDDVRVEFFGLGHQEALRDEMAEGGDSDEGVDGLSGGLRDDFLCDGLIGHGEPPFWT